MKTLSLDTIYSKINKQVSLIESYTEVKGLSFIIRTCRLKPYDFLFKKNNNIVLHKWWIDEYGNSLILDNKKLSIIFNDLRIDRNHLVSTDLYAGLSINNVIKISKLIYVNYGIDDFHQSYYHISFLGLDNYLRSYFYSDNTLENMAPLTMGLANLKSLVKHRDIKYFIFSKNKENSVLPCTKANQWISCLPSHDNFIKEMKKNHEFVYNIIKEK